MLRPLQKLLETIYDAPCGHDVRDFLLTAARGSCRASVAPRAADEELVLVRAAALLPAWPVHRRSAVLARLDAQRSAARADRRTTSATSGPRWKASATSRT